MKSEAIASAIPFAESAVRHGNSVASQKLWSDFWGRMLSRCQHILRRRAPRRLRLCESLPLGERRFVAVIEFEHSRFLLGGTSSSLVLLARLGHAGEKTSALDSDAEIPGAQH